MVSPLYYFQVGNSYQSKYLEHSDCASCRQFARRRKFNSARARDRAKGVADTLLHKFSEPPIDSNENCEMCVQRKAYKAVKARLYRKKGK